MVSSKVIKDLNSRIEKLNTERTKAETRKEVLMGKLEEELKAYKSAYGVDLSGKSFEDIHKKVKSEVSKVTSRVEEEYKLKLKVVEAINNGDFDEARELLGVEVVSKEEVGEKETAEGALEEFEEEEDSGVTPVVEKEEEEEDFGLGDEDEPEEEEEELEGPTSFLSAVSKTAEKKAKSAGKSAMVFPTLKAEDDEEVEEVEEEEETEEIAIPKASKSIKGSSIKETAAMLQVEDEDDDFGFGEMLKGSKFE